MTIGFLHPGAMGESLAATCNSSDRLWVGEGRSEATAARAAAAGLEDGATLAGLVERCDTIVSICPPGHAETVAADVADLGFRGTYVDANAIAPVTTRRMALRFRRFVDGSVIGPPAHGPGTTRLYLSGAGADEVADLWDQGHLDARVMDARVGAASALKMAYAAKTKLGSALELAIRAYAAAEGIDAALVDEWKLSQPGLAERTERVAAGVGPKAWRFAAEMEQMAEAFDAAGLPDGFALAGAAICRRLADLRDRPDVVLDDVLALLR